ncbi:MAG: glutathione S-transferase family protein [Kiloniellales bacterium]
MLEVWGRRNSSNVIPVMWAIGEMGLPHVRHDVGGSFGGLDTPAYGAMNPNRKVPTITDDGLVLWESNAILRYLGGRYGVGTLWPEAPGPRAHVDQWMDWHKTTAYPDFSNLFWSIVRTEPALRDPTAIAALTRSTGEAFRILDAQLAKHPFVVGDELTLADIPLGSAAYRYFNLEIERPELPHMTAWYERLCERPAYQEHAMIPFGRKPAEWYLLEREGSGAEEVKS